MPIPQNRDPAEDAGAALGETLKDLRQAAGFTTLAAAGTRVGYSPDSIGKAETGAHVPTPEMLALLLDLYGVTGDLMRRSVLRQHALARTVSGPVREFARKYFAAEAVATFLRLFGLLLIPGPLQKREYCHAMFLLGRLDEEDAAEQTKVRMQRRERVDGDDPAHVTALIHQRALYFQVGSPAVMAAQLADLLELSRRRNVVIQVIPDEGYFPGAEGAFEIASGPGMPDIMALATVKDHVSDDPDEVRDVTALFQKIHGYARSVAQSGELITEAIEFWNSRQQQQ
ncbi:MAG TPA: helix-turn-helix transcriptional regulator [Trebonia sp.]|nr:helix-turn-helix transcriptional regulator [Trebonia sp.]